MTPHAVAVFAGHGIDGYRMALERVADAAPTEDVSSDCPATSATPTRTR